MEPFIGQIQPFGFNFAPRGWFLCNGALLPVSSHSALFSLIGCTFGGDCRTTFALPDLRGRSIVHVGTGPGLPHTSWGQKLGSQTTTLNSSNLPSHNHAGVFNATSSDATVDEPGTGVTLGTGQVIFSNGAKNATLRSGTITTGNTGNNVPFNNYNPGLGINYCIAEVGIYPSRS